MLAAADQDFVAGYLAQSAEALHAYRSDPAQILLLGRVTAVIVAAFQGRGKLLLAGNGGSAGDAQHIAGEFTGRMLYDRPPLPAVALSTDTSAMTAIGNDYGFEKIFERQVLALGQKGDVLLALSTSGNSPNVLRALEAGRARGLTTIGFTGADGGGMAARSDVVLRAPSSCTPVIQQIHMVAAHIVCSLVERAMFPKGN
jgi:D-sedoheptulose 7-phosphate isomerase